MCVDYDAIDIISVLKLINSTTTHDWTLLFYGHLGGIQRAC